MAISSSIWWHDYVWVPVLTLVAYGKYCIVNDYSSMHCNVQKIDLFLLSFPKVKARLEWMLLKFGHNICVDVFYIVRLK